MDDALRMCVPKPAKEFLCDVQGVPHLEHADGFEPFSKCLAVEELHGDIAPTILLAKVVDG